MTKIVYWNIQVFGINKIANPSTVEDPNTGGLTYAASSASRYTLIKNTIEANTPDIIVIVEVSAGGARAGDLPANGAGVQGATRILTDLRTADPNAEWRMVPPLKLTIINNTETVAVLYRGVSGSLATNDQVTRYFTGPNTWTGGENGISSNSAAATASDYPVPYANFLDTPRQIPQGAQYRGNNGHQWESQSAARIAFYPVQEEKKRTRSQMNNDPVHWGNTTRAPFMTSFHEVFSDGTAARNLTVFSIHTTPGTPSRVFVTQLSQTLDIVTEPVADEIKIICGDFNLNALLANGDKSAVYESLTATNALYTSLINPPDTMQAGTDLRTYKGQFATHIQLPRVDDNDVLIEDDRFLWSTATDNSNYPGYNYFDPVVNSQNSPQGFYSIDNILVWPGANAANNPYYQFTILNPVVGSPFNIVNPAFTSQFTALPVGMIWPQDPAPTYTQDNAIALISWGNYGRVISTSDHLALYASV
jgi:hypothetical protein